MRFRKKRMRSWPSPGSSVSWGILLKILPCKQLSDQKGREWSLPLDTSDLCEPIPDSLLTDVTAHVISGVNRESSNCRSLRNTWKHHRIEIKKTSRSVSNIITFWIDYLTPFIPVLFIQSISIPTRFCYSSHENPYFIQLASSTHWNLSVYHCIKALLKIFVFEFVCSLLVLFSFLTKVVAAGVSR